MTLGAHLDAGLAVLRGQAESKQVDRCKVTRDGDGVRVLDEATLAYTDPARVTVYEGPCEVKQVQGAQFERPTGEQVSTLVAYVVKLPITAVGILEGHQVDVLTAKLDPDLAGLQVVVRAVNRGTRLTSRRLVCTEFA